MPSPYYLIFPRSALSPLERDLVRRLGRTKEAALPKDARVMYILWSRLLSAVRMIWRALDLQPPGHELTHVTLRLDYLEAWAFDRYLRIRLVEIGEENEEFLAYQSLTAELANYL